MPASVASSEPEEEQQSFIIDIDILQSHGELPSWLVMSALG
jgi:hypothetical protein